MTQTFWIAVPGVLRTYAIHAPSGDHAGSDSSTRTSEIFSGAPPSRVDEVDVAVPRERDTLAGRLPGWVRVVLLRGGERSRSGPVGVHHEDVRRAGAAADERDLRPVGGPRWLDLEEGRLPDLELVLRSGEPALAVPVRSHDEDRVLAVPARHEREVRARGIVAAAAGGQRGAQRRASEARRERTH